MSLTRRLALHLLALLPALPALARTPAQAEGPFYPTPRMRFADADNDLIRIEGAVRQAGGVPMHLTGRVLDAQGNPVAGARVEIWQCDANGRYLHTGDRQTTPRDPGFQGFGHVVTESDGAYAFRTIVPVAYPGRTPHVHVKVRHGGAELTTQFYLADHPGNDRDALFRRLSPEDRRALSMRLDRRPDGPVAQVDIRL